MNIKRNGEITFSDEPMVYSVQGDTTKTRTTHYFGVVDTKGREFGARVDIVAKTYGEIVSEDEAVDAVPVTYRWSSKPDTETTCRRLVDGYYHGRVHNATIYYVEHHAQRDGADYGASHGVKWYYSLAAAERAAAAYVETARKRAAKNKAAAGTIDDGYRFKRDEPVVTPISNKTETVQTIGGDSNYLRHPFFNTERWVS